MRKRWPILFAVLALGIAAAWLLHQDPMYKKMQAGQEMIGKIEHFQQIHGCLPDSLLEIGINEKLEGPVFYEKKADGHYVIWFGTVLGSSIVYDSEKKVWEEHY